MKTTYIFDLDGVLLSTDEYHYQAWKKLADELGIYFDRTVNQRMRGVSRMDSLEILLENYTGTPFSPRQKQKLAAKKNDYYVHFLSALTPDFVDPEVRRTLQGLRDRGYRLAVGSSSRNTKYILKMTDLTSAFDAVSDGTNITRSKPDPEVFLKAAEFLGRDPVECTVAEDAESGIEAAKNAGMTAIGIGPAADARKTDIPIRAISDLLEIA